METIQIAANSAVTNIALGLISLLAAYAMYGIYKLTEKAQAQISQIKDETARRKLENALADVENLATITVCAIEQTTASALRAAVKDGKVSRNELTALALQAKTEINAAVGPETRNIINKSLGSFDGYISKLIEERVLEIKSVSGY